MADVDVTEFGSDDVLLDPDSLDPNYHYRFIQDRRARIGRARAQGYTPVNADDGVELLTDLEGDAPTADGLIRDGDRILMKVKKDRYQERLRQSTQLKRARLASPVGSFRKKARDVEAATQKEVRVTTDKE